MLPDSRQAMLTQLIQTAFQTGAAEFKKKAMDALGRLVPFDMALWGSGRIEGIVVHDFYLHGMPEKFMAAWEQGYKQQDRLLQGIIANPGVTHDVFDFYAQHERPRLEIYRQHADVFGVQNAIATAYPNRHTGLLEVMSLYRRDKDKPFTREERQAKEFVFPMMVEAWHGNQIQHLRISAGAGSGGAAAICDPQGWLRHAENAFMDLLCLEWPGCQPWQMPQPLRKWLAGGGENAFKGKRVVFKIGQLAPLVLLLAYPRGELDLLTKREEEVAELWAAGLTHVEISENLVVSPATVRRHIESIYSKLGVSSKVELHQALWGSH